MVKEQEIMDGSKMVSKGIKTTISDIVEHKSGGEELEESKRRYETFAQMIPDIIYEVDSEENFTFVSNSIKRLGYTPEELIGKHFKEIIHPADFKKISRDKVLPKYSGKITGDEGSPKFFDERRTKKRITKNLGIRLVVKKQQGQLADCRYGEVYSSGKWDKPLAEKDKKLIGSIGIIRDITEHKKTEQEHSKIVEAERQKAEELKKAYAELQASKDELVRSEKLAHTGRIAASIAHEVRNPLTNVVMSIQQLKKAIKPENPKVKHIEIIERNTERINYLITELLNCARPPKLNLHLYNIHKVLKNVLNSAETKIRSNRIKVNKSFTSRASKIMIDREQIERVFSNIALNAIEAMPKGGILTISTEVKENFFVIKIHDTGKGIPEKDIIRIFDPFFSSKSDGVGLGLTLCYGIIASHGGTIEVESQWKKGVIFTVSLPLFAGHRVGGGVVYTP